MSHIKKMEFLDYAAIAVKSKKMLGIIFLCSIVLSYVGIYLFIADEYQASATIISSEDNSLGGLAALAKNISSLPVGIGGVKKATDMDLYNTILFSRTCIETVIVKFDLNKLYGFQKKDDALRAVRSMIKSEITLDDAYVVKVSAKTPILAAEMTNFLVSYLNDKIIELNVAKSKDNRMFLENRYAEVSADLASAEDSLRTFQERFGLLDAENQMKATVEAYAKLDGEVLAKQVESDILSKIYGNNSPQVENAKVVAREYQNKIEALKRGSAQSSVLMNLNSLPKKALEYFRLYRSVKLYTKMLEFVVPLYEQAKFDERKDVPILQVIDKAVPPEKKSFPPRSVLSLVIAFSATMAMLIALLVKETFRATTNPKLLFIKNELIRHR
jgi:tyrosine-protein kinase Etk/Wzc